MGIVFIGHMFDDSGGLYPGIKKEKVFYNILHKVVNFLISSAIYINAFIFSKLINSQIP
jgi:hypothetical protein